MVSIRSSSQPVFVKTDNQLTHSRRNLVVTVPQYLKEGVAQSFCAGSHGDPLFDEEGTDLVDRRCPSGDQARSDSMAGLQIELILCLLARFGKMMFESRPQLRFMAFSIMVGKACKNRCSA
jgi:hypothetical protein